MISDHPDRLRDLYNVGITKVILPEFDVMMATEQKNIHHSYSVGEHTIRAVMEVGKDSKDRQFTEREKTLLRLTMLFHDIEKPSTLTVGKDGQNHFYGHQEKGALTAKNILRRLKFDNDTIQAVTHLVKWHDNRFGLTPSSMRKAVSKIGKEYMELLFEVQRADTSAKNPELTKEKYEIIAQARKLYEEILEREECVTLKELKVNGKDLIAIGIVPGKELGEMLDLLLQKVLEDPQLNEKETLLQLIIDKKNDKA